MRNMWSDASVSVAQLMGEETVESAPNNEEALFAEVERMNDLADAKSIEAEKGWDDVMPKVPEGL